MREEVLVAMPTSQAPPPVPHPIQIFIHVEHRTGARRGENCCMPNLVKMADGLTPSVLNRRSI
jgi:hypothetical protein